MLGSPASPRKRPFELLSDLVDDGGLGEDLHPERWDVSALDEMARYTKLGLGVGGEAVLMGRWGRSWEEQDEEARTRSSRHVAPPIAREVQAVALGREEDRCVPGAAAGGGQDGEVSREVYQVAQEEEEEVAAASLALEHCSEEHNYSLSQEEALGAGPTHSSQTGGVRVGETPQDGQSRDESQAETELDEDEEGAEEEDEEEEDEEEEEETAPDAELSSSSETECEVEAEPARQPGERPAKRRCFWEYRRAREAPPTKRKVGGEVRWSLSWSSSTLPSTLYRREGKKGRRKARKTDASDLTPNPQKLLSIGEQLQKLNAAIDGMGPVNELPAVARARSRKEKNKLASSR
ncbi:CREB3 regulatory factor-like [Brachionichthys hirsutus]|uniref:CREB3 regulatory factor-like n=1 Tax=Brachionichthys hirsutus TaxID=412623 RepID=UPI00360438E0